MKRERVREKGEKGKKSEIWSENKREGATRTETLIFDGNQRTAITQTVDLIDMFLGR